MNTVKELLRHMIERMSDTDARQLLEFAQHLRHRRDDSLALKRLATDLTFKGPGSGTRDRSAIVSRTSACRLPACGPSEYRRTALR
jgi:hypothetical protein